MGFSSRTTACFSFKRSGSEAPRNLLEDHCSGSSVEQSTYWPIGDRSLVWPPCSSCYAQIQTEPPDRRVAVVQVQSQVPHVWCPNGWENTLSIHNFVKFPEPSAVDHSDTSDALTPIRHHTLNSACDSPKELDPVDTSPPSVSALDTHAKESNICYLTKAQKRAHL